MTAFDSLLTTIFFGNTAWQWILAWLLFAFVLLSSQVFNEFLVKKIQSRISGQHSNVGSLLWQLVAETPYYFFVFFALYLPAQILLIPDRLDSILSTLFIVLVALQLVRIASKIAVYLIHNINGNDEADASSKNVLSLIAKIIIWLTALMLVLINLGIEITPLVTSLWIWGIAVAFALQNILSDIFSSFSIFFDKPFKVGDFILLWGDAGTVTDITLKSTRIKTLDGPDLIIPNKEVMNTRINNYAHIQRRRVKQQLWVVYNTTKKQLTAIPSAIQDIVNTNDKCSFKRCVFKEYGSFSLNFELVYYTEVSAYDDHLSLVQDINYAIFEKFADMWVDFAFPTQTVHVAQEGKEGVS